MLYTKQDSHHHSLAPIPKDATSLVSSVGGDPHRNHEHAAPCKVDLVHREYSNCKSQKGRLELASAAFTPVGWIIGCALAVSLLGVVVTDGSSRVGASSVVVLLFVCGALAARSKQKLNRKGEALSEELLRLERQLWKLGASDFTSEHAARHSLMQKQTPVLLRVASRPSRTVLASDRLMQSMLDLVVAPFGAAAQVRADSNSLIQSRRRIASVLGANEEDPSDISPVEVGLVCSSTFDPTNSEANVAVSAQAKLWQEQDPANRILLMDPTLRPESFDPWENNNVNRLSIYLPQHGRRLKPSQLASKTASLLVERPDVRNLSMFCHRDDHYELGTSLAQIGILANTAYRHDPDTKAERGKWKTQLDQRYHHLNAPVVTTPLTFDVGRHLNIGSDQLMQAFFTLTRTAIYSTLLDAQDIRVVERYDYDMKAHRVSLGLSSWLISANHRQDLLWEIFQSFATFYRTDGDWKRAGSPDIAVTIDGVLSIRSGEFMELLAVARQTRKLFR